MGVLNVTPDSFSDGGLHLDPTAALGRARMMVAEGASVIDVGGESTRPGAQPVGIDVELSRVVPVVEALVAELGEAQPGGTVRVSVDTRHAEVAAAAVAAGASLINDVSATLWPVAAELGVGWVGMHGCTDPRTMQDAPAYDDVVAEVCGFLVDRAAQAVAAGVPEVWIDPGIGFSKTITHNLELLANLDVLVATGYRVLVGTSRKSTLGALVAAADRVAGPVPTEERLEASVATAVWAFDQGVHMVRVHDVLPTVQAARVVVDTMAD
jgi:dihydropteroate synthase